MSIPHFAVLPGVRRPDRGRRAALREPRPTTSCRTPSFSAPGRPGGAGRFRSRRPATRGVTRTRETRRPIRSTSALGTGSRRPSGPRRRTSSTSTPVKSCAGTWRWPDRRIAAVGPDLSRSGGPCDRAPDARGKVLVPGFLDGHTHLDIADRRCRRSCARRSRAVSPPWSRRWSQVTSALGVPGARWFLDTLRAQPIHAYATAPVISYLAAEAGIGAPLGRRRGAPGAPRRSARPSGSARSTGTDLLPEPGRLLPLINRCPRARQDGGRAHGAARGARGS